MNQVSAYHDPITYRIELTDFVNGDRFFDLTGIPEVAVATVLVTFDPNASMLFPENYSGTNYIYEEYYTPWTSFSLSFGDTVFEAFPTGSNPYTSIRVRDGISDGDLDISDSVLLDAELTSLTPNGYELTQALLSFFSYDETAFSGSSVPSPDVLNALTDGTSALSIPFAFEGTIAGRFLARAFHVEAVSVGTCECSFQYDGRGKTWIGIDSAERIFGGRWNDSLEGEGGRDVLVGRAGDDFLSGGSGNDRLVGGKGNDCLIGGAGNDKLFGGRDSDHLVGGDGSDRLYAGHGEDEAVYVLGSNYDCFDMYDGGRGVDTLVLKFSKEEWSRPEIQADVANFLDYLDGKTNPINGEVRGPAYLFSELDLRAKRFEELKVISDCVEVDLGDLYGSSQGEIADFSAWLMA